MCGSHIDTVRTGGRYDGNLGVLGGLEVVQTLNDAGLTTRRPFVVGVFTDEEGARFHPDMAGSLAYVGGMPLDELYATRGIDGKVFRDELERIGYLGDAPMPLYRPHAFVELHVEQGPVLDLEGITIGAVEDLQGISWTEVLVTGQSNHAGTTPMRMRHDAGYCAAAIGVFVRNLVKEIGGRQVGTVGSITLHPNLTNVVAARARVTVDLRNTDDDVLKRSEARLAEFLEQLARDEGVKIETHSLARFAPVQFDTGHRGAGRAHRAAARPLVPPDDLRRRPRRADAGAHLPDRDDLRAVGQGHQPQPGRAHRAGSPRGRGRRAAAHGARARGVGARPWPASSPSAPPSSDPSPAARHARRWSSACSR